MTQLKGKAGKQRGDYSWDFVFLISGKPLPAMLDLAFFAQNSGLRSLVIVLERGHEDLKIDEALINYEIITIDVPYKTVDLKRLTSIPAIYRKLKTIIVEGLEPDGTIVTASYDLLLFGRMIAAGRKYKLTHEVRDLHALQLSRSLKSRFFVSVERFLLKRVDRLLVSSPAFVDKYYRNIFRGKTVLVENTPSRLTWADFKRDQDDGCFTIGFIGIIRYQQSLKQLIRAVHVLSAEGIRLKVVFAGGGSVDDLIEEIKDRQLFEFLGPYEYSKDIKRLYANLDLIYSVYDSNDLNCQIAMPNKFYESIISKIPIVVAKNTFVEEEVLRLGIGASVLSGDVEGLVSLLRKAILPGEWYARALDQLRDCDANLYFDAYEKALEESILA